MICKVVNNELVRVSTSIDRTGADKVMDYETYNGKVQMFTISHYTFFIVEIYYQKLLILSENVLETVRTIRYLRQCGLSRGDCQ